MKTKIATFIALAIAAAPVMAQDFDSQVFHTQAQPVKAIELSQTEMKETQGSALWFAPAIMGGARVLFTGFTRHGLNQAISRGGVGVSNKVILNTMRNPVKVVSQNGGRTKFIGADRSAVILNQNGKVITTWGKPR